MYTFKFNLERLYVCVCAQFHICMVQRRQYKLNILVPYAVTV